LFDKFVKKTHTRARAQTAMECVPCIFACCWYARNDG